MRICIVGVGNIGMRYVQGITKTFPDAELILVDTDARLMELERQSLGKVTLSATLDGISEPVDLFVISTSCEPRLAIYEQCLGFAPRYIILEKYLFKSRDEFHKCLSLNRVPTFVNQWMYGSRAFDCLFQEQVRSVAITGSGWGLACNAVHWIDVLKRHLNISQLRVGSDTTVSDVFPSKRAGYQEISGEWIFVDAESDKSFRLIDGKAHDIGNMLKITVDDRVYTFDYAEIAEGARVLSRFPYFSSLIGGIVGEIMDKGSCQLPLLEESVSQHLLIEDILDGLEPRPKIT